MYSPKYLLENGVKVITHSKLEDPIGILVKTDYLHNRSNNCPGIICGIVGGHGGDVYWVKHSHGIAAYCFTDFELA